jgi:predicted nucleic acid-binding protein
MDDRLYVELTSGRHCSRPIWIERAVKLRQFKSMSLGDAIVAATALENNCQLLTANIDDFSHINDLLVSAPFS